MFVVLASRSDAAAADLVRRWDRHGAKLLTCEGLSRRGWSFIPERPEAGFLVLDGERVPVTALRGLVTLLPAVGPGELPHIVPADREYIANELMAFLVAWLSSLPCTVVNRPSPLCLSGPHLHDEQWLRAALAAGLPILESERRAGGTLAPEGTTPLHEGQTVVRVVAGRSVEPDAVPPWIAEGVARLALSVGAGLLTVRFVEVEGELRFEGAVPLVDVGRPEVAAALLPALGGPP